MRIMGLSAKVFFILLAVVIAAVFFGYKASVATGLTKPTLNVKELSATVFNQPRAVAKFSLTDNKGQVFDNKSLQGKWSLLFFGFTNCPYICPTTMAELNKVYQKVSKDEDITPPTVVMVSVDPERDTVEKVDQFVKSFNPAFQGATGDAEQLSKLAKSMSVLYMKLDKNNTSAQGENNYDVEHSGAVLLVDPKGQLYAVFTSPINVDNMADDISKIEKSYRG